MSAYLITRLAEVLIAKSYKLATAESCTGGLVATMLTDVAGSSAWFSRSAVTYSNTAKTEMLSVREQTLIEQGAVSEAVVLEMVAGLLASAEVDVALAISGVAGPSGGTDDKPVGTVWISWQIKESAAVSKCFHFDGDRTQIRQQAAIAAISRLVDLLSTDQ